MAAHSVNNILGRGQAPSPDSTPSTPHECTTTTHATLPYIVQRAVIITLEKIVDKVNVFKLIHTYIHTFNLLKETLKQ